MATGLRALDQPTYQPYRWTTARLDLLLSLCGADGQLRFPKTEAARRLGCGMRSLEIGLYTLDRRGGHKPFTWTPAAIATLASITDANGRLTVTREEAAALIGCEPHAIEYRRRSARRQPLCGTAR